MNFQKILSFIAYFEEIHGICILMKPNESRLTNTFEFCIKELLTQLHKSAASTIMFCFTNTRSCGYRPGMKNFYKLPYIIVRLDLQYTEKYYFRGNPASASAAPGKE